MSEQNPSKINQLIIPFSIIIAGVIVAGSIYLSKGPTPSAGTDVIEDQGADLPTAQQPTADVDVSQVKTSGLPFVGKQDAPVVVATWGDYQCPFCKRFEAEVIQQLVKDYPNDVRIVFKDFQFLGNDSQTAGIAGRAVWEVAPNKYFDWRKAMYEKQDDENSGFGSREDILSLTKTILGTSNANKVDKLMTSKQTEYQKAIDDDKAEGGTFGINGTPGTIINKSLVSGAQTYSSVRQVVDLALQGN